jgi:hypothetical protein
MKASMHNMWVAKPKRPAAHAPKRTRPATPKQLEKIEIQMRSAM